MVSAEAVKQYESMVAQIRRLGNEIKRLEQQEEIERQIYGESFPFADGSAVNYAIGSSSAGSAYDVYACNAPGEYFAQDAGEKVSPVSSVTYSRAFSDMVRGQGDFAAVQDALSMGVDSEGGYTVPDEFDKKLVRCLSDHNVVRRLAKTIRTESGMHKIPILAGEAAAGWIDESTPIPETTMAYDRITLGAHKLGALLKCSTEFLHDTAFDIEDYVADSFSLAVGRKEEEAFINGTGVKMPAGLLHDTDGAGTGVITENTGDVTFDDVIRLYYSLGAPYRKDAVFLCNEDLLMRLMLLKDKNDNYIWKPSLEIGKPDTILGKPIHTSNAMPELNAGNKVLLFGNFDYYWIADRGNRTLRRLNKRFAIDDSVGFILIERLDGKLILKDAMKVLKVKA